MNILRTIFLIIKKTLIAFFSIWILYFVITVVLSLIPSSAEVNDDDKTINIYITNSEVHSDIVLPIETRLIDWNTIFKHNDNSPKNTQRKYISIGWGSKDFYLNVPEWSDVTPRLILGSIFGFEDSVLHISYYNSIHENDSCVKIQIPDNQYKRLIQYILSSLKYNSLGKPIQIKSTVGYPPTNAFYEAKGHYSLFYTCNTWTNNALKACGLKASLWTPFVQGVFFHY